MIPFANRHKPLYFLEPRYPLLPRGISEVYIPLLQMLGPFHPMTSASLLDIMPEIVSISKIPNCTLQTDPTL